MSVQLIEANLRIFDILLARSIPRRSRLAAACYHYEYIVDLQLLTKERRVRGWSRVGEARELKRSQLEQTHLTITLDRELSHG